MSEKIVMCRHKVSFTMFPFDLWFSFSKDCGQGKAQKLLSTMRSLSSPVLHQVLDIWLLRQSPNTFIKMVSMEQNHVVVERLAQQMSLKVFNQCKV